MHITSESETAQPNLLTYIKTIADTLPDASPEEVITLNSKFEYLRSIGSIKRCLTHMQELLADDGYHLDDGQTFQLVQDENCEPCMYTIPKFGYA